MANYRAERLSQEIQREVTDILRREVRDPRVAQVNITGVDVTGDLQQATIYYSLLSDKASDNQKAEQGLTKATGLVRKLLGSRLQVYKTPELKFVKDESLAYGDHIDKLLNDMYKN